MLLISPILSCEQGTIAPFLTEQLEKSIRFTWHARNHDHNTYLFNGHVLSQSAALQTVAEYKINNMNKINKMLSTYDYM